MYYIIAYVLMNIGAFGCVILVSNSIKSDCIEEYSGLSRREPALAFCLALFLLSLAGIPPLAGFFGKFMVFAAAIQSKYYMLAIAGVVNSVLAVFYYVKVIKFMYINDSRTSAKEPKPFPAKLAIIIALIGILVIGLFPVPFINWIGNSLL
jgi:NADH-quinone oxidoreductase subunit N